VLPSGSGSCGGCGVSGAQQPLSVVTFEQMLISARTMQPHMHCFTFRLFSLPRAYRQILVCCWFLTHPFPSPHPPTHPPTQPHPLPFADATGDMLILIEPGTPPGFAAIAEARHLVLTREGRRAGKAAARAAAAQVGGRRPREGCGEGVRGNGGCQEGLHVRQLPEVEVRGKGRIFLWQDSGKDRGAE
jgi:hypothetical protein